MESANEAQALIFIELLGVEHKDLTASIGRRQRSRGNRRNPELEKQIRMLQNERMMVEQMIEKLQKGHPDSGMTATLSNSRH